MNRAPGPAYYLAEWYLPELTKHSVDDVVAKIDLAASKASGEGMPVRLVVTLAVPADEVLYGVFSAQSPDIVTATCQRAHVPHQRLSAYIDMRIRQDPPAATAEKACTRGGAEPGCTPQ